MWSKIATGALDLESSIRAIAPVTQAIARGGLSSRGFFGLKARPSALRYGWLLQFVRFTKNDAWPRLTRRRLNG